MALIKVLKFVNGLSTQANPDLDSIYALTFRVGGTNGTDLTKAILDTLTAGPTSDASSLHQHDSRYYTKSQHVASSTGLASAAAPVILDSRGKLDPSLYQQSDITHGNLAGLSADDHPQYYNQSRGDARYYTQATFISTSAGVASAGLPVKTNAQGIIDSTLVSSASINHEGLAGLLGGAANDHQHFTTAEHSALAGGTNDASSLHNHNTQYYTKTQVDASLALKANDNIVIKKDGTVAFTADQSHGGHKITNMADGSAASDSASFGQMQAADALKLNKAGDAMSGALDMGGNFIHNVAPAVAGTDAVNLNVLHNFVSGISWRPATDLMDSVHTTKPATTATQIDSVTVLDQYRVLFTNLTTGNNEVYLASVTGSAITWTLQTDGQSGTGTPQKGDSLDVEFGTIWGGSAQNFNGTVWTQFNGAGQIQAGVGLSKTGNTLSVVTGAGITFLPTGDVGVNVSPTGGLDTVDPSTGAHSTAANAVLAHKLADATLVMSASGLAAGVMQTANIADQSITTAKHADGSVTQPKLGTASVGTAQLIDANVTTAKIVDGNVTGAKLAANAAGVGLAQNGVTKGLDVQVDNASIDINGSNQVEVKALGITNAKIAAAAVNAPKIDFGTGANQVSGANLPLTDAPNHFVTKNAEAALSDLADSTYVIAETSGEALGVGDLVVVRRDASNNARVYKASAAGADNVVAATLVVQDITYTGINSIFFSGNAVSVAYTNPGAINSALSVSVTGNAITVSLATNGSAALTSTATQIAAAINASPAASALVTAAVTGTGTNIETAAAAASLSAGVDYNDNSRWEVYGAALDAAAAAGTSVRIRKSGKLSCTFVAAPATSDIGKAVYLSINKGKAQLASPTSTNDGIVYIGRLVSATQVEYRASTLRGVNG